MKRLFLILLAALTVVCCSPLRIAMNRTDSNGARNILTTGQHLFRSKLGNIDIALGAKIQGKDTVMAFLITCNANTGHGIFNKGDRMMFRLGDGSEIALTNLYDKEYDEHEETSVHDTFKTDYAVGYSYSPIMDAIYITPYEITRVVPQVNRYKISNSYALYLVTDRQLKDLMTKDVKKVRVEAEDDDLDMTQTEGVSQLIRELFICVRDEASHIKERSEF